MFLTQGIKVQAGRFLLAVVLPPLAAACTDGPGFGPQPEERPLAQAAGQEPSATAKHASTEKGEAAGVLLVACPLASDVLDDDETSEAGVLATGGSCPSPEVETAEAKLQHVQLVNRRSDIYQFAEAIFADMDMDKNGVLSGDELNPNSMFVQAYILNASTSPRNGGDSQGSVSATLEEADTSMFISDFVNPITGYFESADANGDGILDPDESLMFARFVYPDEVQVLELHEGRQ